MIKVLKNQNFKKIIEIAVKSIKEGRVLACPTDTVYGLICDATNKKAVEKLFQIKRRLKRKPIPIFVKNIRQVKKLARTGKRQEIFLKSIWPGKVTVILKRRGKTKIYGIIKKTIGLRIPNYKLVNILLKKLDIPLTGTSANISGKPPSGNIKEILKQFKGKKYQPDLIIDAGNLSKCKPSTVLDLTNRSPKILRN